jgi:hypothetical protein
LGFTAPDDDGNSVIMDHEVGKTANGAPLGDYFETAPFDVGEGEMLMFLSMIEPHFSHQSGNVGITLIGWMYQNSTPFEYPTELVAEPTTTQLFPRFSARRMALRIRGLTTGGFWRYGKLIFDGKARGAKR